ncbi:histidine triad (HIT) family protein [Curtobacterium sp. PhB172]|nr:histidine triad (HIT) family protein [Curtobacterium sp. PhB171]ROQ23982.1 histidine triad (HIT) family protein [Curtobacterium sp. PhB170]ROS34380.1 histidine triad (HIT) family protein [Curtobacterium sp. PhB78]ROS35896.1 histidine triad (HIT) family protein [Curtobacterium sp. PhB131]ROS67025.1 histidine triad (HIT) family protein [Curtobacterium sp. PhB172]ROS70005.1 histidine triad (HIT) family protein [Curtobacterium sp. PhB141]TCU84815.1 histidine triad (HIT) family protein [Curtoba
MLRVQHTGRMASCVFCAIIAGDEPAVWVEREDHAVAFAPLPGSALAPGHTLVVPVEHADDLLGAAPVALAATVALAQRVARAMRGALGATGTVVLQASGADAGQSVRHLHFHVVPCWPDDGTTHWPEPPSAHVVDGDPHALLAEMFE